MLFRSRLPQLAVLPTASSERDPCLQHRENGPPSLGDHVRIDLFGPFSCHQTSNESISSCIIDLLFLLRGEAAPLDNFRFRSIMGRTRLDLAFMLARTDHPHTDVSLWATKVRSVMLEKWGRFLVPEGTSSISTANNERFFVLITWGHTLRPLAVKAIKKVMRASSLATKHQKLDYTPFHFRLHPTHT